MNTGMLFILALIIIYLAASGKMARVLQVIFS